MEILSKSLFCLLFVWRITDCYLLPEANSSKISCISTSEEYTEHLNDVLTNGDSALELCNGIQLMSRIQSLYTDQPDPTSLSKYGVYWAFVSGPDVLNKFLKMAEDHQSDDDRVDLLKYMLNFAGFSDDMINYSKKYSLVIFDKEKMDNAWSSGPYINRYGPFQPTWESLQEYFINGFQVCQAEDFSDCTQTTAIISEEAVVAFSSQSYQEITGCKEGYSPDPLERGFVAEECYNGCPDNYCSMIGNFSMTRSGGSPACVELYNNAPLDFVSEDIQWTRAFLESCMSCSQWFTGEGIGYNPVEDITTGTEWIVRGDKGVPLTSLASSRYTIYQP